MKPVLEVISLTKTYDKKTVLKDVSFKLYPGDILGIIGPNGAGKTTLLYTLLGVVLPSSGRIFYFGMEFFKNKAEVLSQVGFASQYLSLPYSLTVEENLKVFGNLYKVKNLKQRIEELLEVFKLKEKKKNLTRALSSGEMMRLNLARAFLNDPKILFLDEPTAGLDPEYIKYVSDLFKTYSSNKRLTIVLTSHQLGELERIADKILLLKNGQIVAFGPLEVLLKQFNVEDLEDLYFKVFHDQL